MPTEIHMGVLKLKFNLIQGLRKFAFTMGFWRICSLLIFCNWGIGCETPANTTEVSADQKIPELMTPDKLKTIVNTNDSVYKLVNFYATWCKPCVKELPDLISLQSTYPKKIKLILISLDDAQVVQEKLPTFLSEQKISFQTWFAPGDYPVSTTLVKTFYPEWATQVPVTLLYSPEGNLMNTWVGRITPDQIVNIIYPK
jgi:thiol-disulfide isomerase/thioredoxin